MASQSSPIANPALTPQSIDVPIKHCTETLNIKCLDIQPKIYLRTGLNDEQLRKNVADTLLISLPEPHSAAANNQITALATAPDEWLLITSHNDHAQILNDLNKLALDGHLLSCHDASSATSCLQLNGASVKNIFSLATEVDLDPALFSIGMCTALRFSQCSAILYRSDVTQYNVYIPRSYTAWIWSWIRAVVNTPSF